MMEKQKSKNSEDFDKFGKEFVELLSKFRFQKVIRQIENFDGRTPETFLTKIKTSSLRLKKPSTEEQKYFQETLLNQFRKPEFASQIKSGVEDCIRDIKKYLEEDSRYSQLLKLISKADQNVEFVSLPFLFPFLDLEKNFVNFCKPIRLLEKVDTSAGEDRKNYIVDIFREIPEPFYFEYLQTILILSFLTENKMFQKEKMPKKFGDLVCQSANRLKDFSGLVVSEMGLLRNSFYHGNFKYILKNDSFIIWDDNKPERIISADELVKIARDITSMCVKIFPLVAQLYLLRNFFINSGFLDFYLERMPAFASETPSEMAKAEKELSEFGSLLTKPMRGFFQIVE